MIIIKRAVWGIALREDDRRQKINNTHTMDCVSKGPKTFTKNYALDISVAIVSNNYFGTPYGCVFGLVFRGEEE